MAETDCSQIASKDFHITAKTTADLGSATKLSQESFVQPALDGAQSLASTRSGRVGQAAVEALKPVNLAYGIGNAIAYDCQHPLEVVKMVVTSALLGAALKVALPVGGPAGRIAGAAVGGYFLYQSGKPIGQGLNEAANARTMTDIHNAAQTMDNAVGSLTVNSMICIAGTKLGVNDNINHALGLPTQFKPALGTPTIEKLNYHGWDSWTVGKDPGQKPDGTMTSSRKVMFIADSIGVIS